MPFRLGFKSKAEKAKPAPEHKNTEQPEVQKKRSKKSTNILARVDECIDNTDATVLDISELDFMEIPTETFRLSTIYELIFSKNPVHNLSNLCYFENLESLDISRCNLASIDDIGLQTVRFLKRLDVSRNNLTSISVLGSFAFLEVLLASHNKLICIPEELETLKILQKFDLSHNKLQDPTSETVVTKMSKLQDLDLRDNNLNPDLLGSKTRQLYEKKLLFSSKGMRRTFVTRALGISKDVISKEQEHIYQSDNQEQEDLR